MASTNLLNLSLRDIIRLSHSGDSVTLAYNFFSYQTLPNFFSLSSFFSLSLENLNSHNIWQLTCLTYSFNSFTTYCSQDIWLCPNLKRHLPLQTLLFEFHTQTSSCLAYRRTILSCTWLDLLVTMLTLSTKTCSS